MSAVDWTTSRDALVAALPSDPLHPLRVLGYEIKTRLEATGAVYDAISVDRDRRREGPWPTRHMPPTPRTLPT